MISLIDYFGIKTLERSYLLKIGNRIVERPQYLYMRVAVGICKGDINMALRIYDDLSQHFYTHATPTLFNAGTKRPQMSSCFLIGNSSRVHAIGFSLSWTSFDTIQLLLYILLYYNIGV